MRAFMFWLVATSLAGTSIDALATDYCVGSTQQLRAALDSAEVDGADSVIQLRSGSYSLTSNARYEPISESFLPAGKLTLRGGYNSDCSSYSNTGGATTINGSNNPILEFVTQTGDVSLAGITFNAAHVLLSSRILSYCLNNRPSFNVRRLRVDQGGIAFNSQCHDVLVDNTLVTNAVSVPDAGGPVGSAIHIILIDYEEERIGSVEIRSSTVINGRVNIDTCCGFVASATLYNNIFERSGSELFIEGTLLLARFNRYDGIAFSNGGALQAGSGNNLSASPQLDADFRPEVTSPMLNSGSGSVPGGLSTIDQTGGNRVVGSNVDRGARESLIDGSGQYIVTNTNASGTGSLTWALGLANDDPGFNTVRFNIPGGCPRIITLSGSLQVRETMAFNGTTQPGSVINTEEISWNAVPCVVLRGNGGIGIESMSNIGDGYISVRGLAFEGFGLAIALAFGDGHQVTGNQFGGEIGSTNVVLSGNEQAIGLIGGGRSKIGGFTEASRNLISGSSDVGVLIATFLGLGGSDNEVTNNLIGLDKNGGSALPNGTGIRINGGNNIIRDNLIAGNGIDGILLAGENAVGNRIENNFIGGGVGSVSFTARNGRMGIMVQGDAHDNQIGPNNIIGRNGDDGVRIFTSAYGGNRITANRILRNNALGIDLGDNGVTDNDLDPQFCFQPQGCRANGGQNFPIVNSAVRRRVGFIPADRPVEIKGTLRSVVGGPYQIEIYGGESCEANGHGEGHQLLGTVSLTIPNEPYCPPPGGLCFICASGNCTTAFSIFVPEIDIAPGDVITTTATSVFGNTSEFSACATVTLEPLPNALFANGFE